MQIQIGGRKDSYIVSIYIVVQIWSATNYTCFCENVHSTRWIYSGLDSWCLTSTVKM